MNNLLLSRAFGISHPGVVEQHITTELLHAIQPAESIFDGHTHHLEGVEESKEGEDDDSGTQVLAHAGGVNNLTIDKFEGRYLLSGGGDSTISIWDLESPVNDNDASINSAEPKFIPLASISKSTGGHKFGTTALHFYPFDSLAFTASSYDHTLKLFSADPLAVSASFNLESVVYDHALSPIAQHLLVACATQHPHVRLVDLRSGAASQALPGHKGAIMSVAWSPKDEYVLASGGVDCTVRLWDVRKSAGHLGTLDQEDSSGILGYGGSGHGARPAARGAAHRGAVNGLIWTEDGRHLVSSGHDDKIRVWDMTKGANTLANFGPLIRNRDLRTSIPCLAPAGLVAQGQEVLFYPNEKEILMYEVFEAKLLKRLRVPGVSYTDVRAKVPKKSKVVALAWRAHTVELYSAHGDGAIRLWKPRTSLDALVDEEDREEERAMEENRKKKRKILEDVYENLSRKRFVL